MENLPQIECSFDALPGDLRVIVAAIHLDLALLHEVVEELVRVQVAGRIDLGIKVQNRLGNRADLSTRES